MDFYDDRTHCLLKQKGLVGKRDPRLWSSSRQSQVPRLPGRAQKGKNWGCQSSLNSQRPPFHPLLLSGSASLAQCHALPHTLLSRSLRREVSTIADIHLFLWELAGDEEGQEVGALAAGSVGIHLLTPSGGWPTSGHSNTELSCGMCPIKWCRHRARLGPAVPRNIQNYEVRQKKGSHVFLEKYMQV